MTRLAIAGPGSIALGRPNRRLVCPISLIAEGQATNSSANLRIVANGGMSYFTERLIHNARVQEDVFRSVNNISVDHIVSYGDRSSMVVIGAASREMTIDTADESSFGTEMEKQ